MENPISYSLQCAAFGMLGGATGAVLRTYFFAIGIPPYLPAALRLVAGPAAGGLLGGLFGYFSGAMIERNEERLGRLRLGLSLSVILDGLLLGLFLH
jgi:hypothetical protein